MKCYNIGIQSFKNKTKITQKYNRIGNNISNFIQ